MGVFGGVESESGPFRVQFGHERGHPQSKKNEGYILLPVLIPPLSEPFEIAVDNVDWTRLTDHVAKDLRVDNERAKFYVEEYCGGRKICSPPCRARFRSFRTPKGPKSDSTPPKTPKSTPQSPKSVRCSARKPTRPTDQLNLVQLNLVAKFS